MNKVIRIFLILLFLSFGLPFKSVSSAQDTQLLERRESSYNNIYVYKRGKIIRMTFGHNKRLYVESEYNQENERELRLNYTRYMTVGLAYPKSIKSVLEIGLGGGRTSWYIHTYLPSISVTSVELDPDVVQLAKIYFGVREENNFHIVVRDGRMYLNKDDKRHDVVLIDAYRGPFVPFHLLTKEFYTLVKRKLNHGGVTVQNIEPRTMLFDAALATMKSVFANIDVFAAGGNVVTVAYDGPVLSSEELKQRASKLQNTYHFYHNLRTLLEVRDPLITFPNRKPLTDDFAPVEYLQGIKKHNERRN